MGPRCADVVVEHRPDVVLKVIQTTPEMYEWYVNEWVHIVALHPEEQRFYYFKNGGFHLYEPMSEQAQVVNDFQRLVEEAQEMETNQIVDATKENLPVYLLN